MVSLGKSPTKVLPIADFNMVPRNTSTLDINKAFDFIEATSIQGTSVFKHLHTRYGFQDDNVKNQEEHLALLLANRVKRRLYAAKGKHWRTAMEAVVSELFNETLENYFRWCSYLKLKRNEERTVELTLVALYFLIWGEAANLRFMPECLCYIFYQLSEDLIKEVRGGKDPIKEVRGGQGSFSFLEDVVRKIYEIVHKEAKLHSDALKNAGSTKGSLNREAVSHTSWRNYDDFNEFFWSKKCMASGKDLKERMGNLVLMLTVKSHEEKRKDPQDFDRPQDQRDTHRPKAGFLRRLFNGFVDFFVYYQRKVLFVEHRSFLHVYHSFHRLWVVNVLILQALALVAFGLVDITGKHAPKNLLSLGPVYSAMNFVQSALDVIGAIGAYRGSPKSFLFRIYIRLLYHGVFTAALAFTFLNIIKSGSLSSGGNSEFWWKCYTGILVVFTCIQMCVYWFSIKPLKEEYYVGREMRQSIRRVLRYMLFWMAIYIPKIFFSYMFQIQPLISPTRLIWRKHIDRYRWHDFVSKHNHNILTILSFWAPVIMVYFMDSFIWFAIVSAIFGFFSGGKSHIGEIRSVDLFIERFEQFPKAFSKTLKAEQHSTTTTGNHSARQQNHELDVFAAYWNKFIRTLADEDYLSKREEHYLEMPSRNLQPIDWPLFLLLHRLQLGKERVRKSAIWNLEGLEKLVIEMAEKRGWSLAIRRDPSSGKNPPHSTWIHDLAEVVQHLERDLESPSINETYTLRRSSRHGKAPQEDSTKQDLERLREVLTLPLDFPKNSEAIRRLLFFGNSLLMKMPKAPLVQNMLSFSILTPHLDEDIFYSLDALQVPNKDGISKLYYLQTIYPDDWENFLQRTGIRKDQLKDIEKDSVDIPAAEESKSLHASQELDAKGRLQKKRELQEKREELRKWASYRGQTLARTVRGMMYYHEAILFQNRQEQQGQDLEMGTLDNVDLANAKFTYVVASQKFGEFLKAKSSSSTTESQGKSEKHQKAEDIEDLMRMYPALRVAYIEEEGGEYFSKLVKYENAELKQVYRIELPGDPIIGEGKPENQNHAIIFTRGDAVQAIDMNQDNYFEEALKMRNLLEEFEVGKGNKRTRRTILGIREHVFTGSISSLAWFMSNQELSFVTLAQRVMANTLRIRMHYGHPDVFSRIFHITRGGISKASKTINLSEDVFAGFNTTLRGGNVTHHEYIQVGKGRDLGLNQISTFEAKVASGNGEQLLSRDVYRLGRLLDFFRMLSFYYTSVGYYFCTLLTVWSLYAYLYGKVYLALSGVESALWDEVLKKDNKALRTALGSQMIFQIGTFTCLPMLLEYFLEFGFIKAMETLLTMQLMFSFVFFVFSLGTRAHYFGRTVLHGGAKYGKTGRGFVIEHIRFADNFRLYSRSHFLRGMEIIMLLIVYRVYGKTDGVSYVLMSVGSWFLALSWLYAPFLFNPLGFDWQKTVDDMRDWSGWLMSESAAAEEEKSWVAWWDKQYKIRTTRSMMWETILSLRFFIIQYGVSFHTQPDSSSLVSYLVSWAAFFLICAIIAFMLSSGNSNNKLRGLHFLTCLIVFTALVVGAVFFMRFDVRRVCASILSLIPTFWGLLTIGIAWKPIFESCVFGKQVFKKIIRGWAWAADAAMGYVIFAPVAFFSYFPFVSPLQTRILFNTVFSRGMEISVLLSGNQEHRA